MNINLTLICQMVIFTGFVWFTMKMIWPHILQALQDREDKIADGLAAAERGHRELELSQHKAVEQMRDAKLKAAEVIESANKRAAKIVEDAKEGRKTGQRMVELAKAEIEQERNATREALQNEIAAIAIMGAEKILGRKIDESANNDMIDKIISEVASGE